MTSLEIASLGKVVFILVSDNLGPGSFYPARFDPLTTTSHCSGHWAETCVQLTGGGNPRSRRQKHVGHTKARRHRPGLPRAPLLSFGALPNSEIRRLPVSFRTALTDSMDGPSPGTEAPRTTEEQWAQPSRESSQSPLLSFAPHFERGVESMGSCKRGRHSKPGEGDGLVTTRCFGPRPRRHGGRRKMGTTRVDLHAPPVPNEVPNTSPSRRARPSRAGRAQAPFPIRLRCGFGCWSVGRHHIGLLFCAFRVWAWNFHFRAIARSPGAPASPGLSPETSKQPLSADCQLANSSTPTSQVPAN